MIHTSRSGQLTRYEHERSAAGIGQMYARALVVAQAFTRPYSLHLLSMYVKYLRSFPTVCE